MGTGYSDTDNCQTGLIPRVMNALFNKIETLKHQIEFQLHVSYIEVYYPYSVSAYSCFCQTFKDVVVCFSNMKPLMVDPLNFFELWMFHLKWIFLAAVYFEMVLKWAGYPCDIAFCGKNQSVLEFLFFLGI